MRILKVIRVGKTTFKPGDEEKLMERAAAAPEQLDFLRLLGLNCIDEIPNLKPLSEEEKNRRLKEIEDVEQEKIELANRLAQEEFLRNQKIIDEAHLRKQEKEKAHRELQDKGEGDESLDDVKADGTEPSNSQ